MTDAIASADPHPALQRLEPFVGEWSMEATFPQTGPAGVAGRTVFERVLGGAYLMQRVEVPHPAAPDSISMIRHDPATGGYAQHFYDSRGVARIYEMTFDDGVWQLLRTKPDFSPLDFSQRYIGRFSDDASTIDGEWETSDDGVSWKLDFRLAYTRVG